MGTGCIEPLPLKKGLTAGRQKQIRHGLASCDMAPLHQDSPGTKVQESLPCPALSVQIGDPYSGQGFSLGCIGCQKGRMRDHQGSDRFDRTVLKERCAPLGDHDRIHDRWSLMA